MLAWILQPIVVAMTLPNLSAICSPRFAKAPLAQEAFRSHFGQGPVVVTRQHKRDIDKMTNLSFTKCHA